MTKQRLKQLFLVPLLAVIFYACYLDVLEVEVSERAGFNIAEARSWFEANVPSKPDGVFLRSGGGLGGSYLPWQMGDKIDKWMPDWENAVVGTDAYFQIIEVPLQGSGRFTQTGSENAERAEETGDERYLATITRLLVRICRETGAKDGFVMIASPDLEYLNRRSDNPMGNFTYLSHGDDFSGLVFFYDLAGEFVTGYKTVDGKFFRFVLQTQADDDEIQLRDTMYCHIICTTISFWWDWFTKVGDDVYLTGSTYLGSVTHCHIASCYGGGGGGIGGGTGTGNGSTEPEEPTEPEQTQAEDIFARPDDMDDDCWGTLERLLDEMQDNCLGRALVGALTRELGTDRMNFQCTNEGNSFRFDAQGRRVSLRTNAAYYILFHEMFHALQSFGVDRTVWNHPRNNPLLNFEMEARFAEYVFLRQTDWFAGSQMEEAWSADPSFSTVMELTDFIDHNGNLLPGVSATSLNREIRRVVIPALRAVPEHARKRHDRRRTGTDNFRNLQNLMTNC